MAEKILVVDDDLETLSLVGIMLQRQGYEIATASSGQLALEMVLAEHPDLILLDLMMPDMDGIEVTRRLRSDSRTKDVPVIMFTAREGVEDKVLGFEAGADDYLTKPTQPREMFARIKTVLARTSKSRPQSVPPGERGHLIGITAVRGGLGVTSLALNLGIALNERLEKNVIVSDYRPGQGTLALELGYTWAEGLNRLLQCKPSEISPRRVEEELLSHPSGLRLLLASPQPGDARYIIAVDNFEAVTRQLLYLGGYIVLDLGPSLPPAVETVIPICDEIMIVVDRWPQTLLQTKLMLDHLAQKGLGAGRIRVVLVDRFRAPKRPSQVQAQKQLEHEVSAVIPAVPDHGYRASIQNTPIILQQPDSPAARQYYKLAELVSQQVR